MYNQSTALFPRPIAPSSHPTTRSSEAPTSTLPTWLASALLMLASSVLLALACASAWLSYHAQVAYVLAHNGNLRAEARVWALLLDAGTAGVSLLRLYETLRRRSGVATRISLLGCIAASVAMNLLHTPSRSPGGFLVAAVPPVMYAVFLEHLLTNLRSLLVGHHTRRSVWRTLELWINFPSLMWSGRRSALRRNAEQILNAPEPRPCLDDLTECVTAEESHEVAQTQASADGRDQGSSARSLRRGRRPGPKRVAFEAALTDQVRSGDLRLFSEDERERNAAAYQAAASLPVPLSRGAARRYVVQALVRMEQNGAVAALPATRALQ